MSVEYDIHESLRKAVEMIGRVSALLGDTIFTVKEETRRLDDRLAELESRVSALEDGQGNWRERR